MEGGSGRSQRTCHRRAVSPRGRAGHCSTVRSGGRHGTAHSSSHTYSRTDSSTDQPPSVLRSERKGKKEKRQKTIAGHFGCNPPCASNGGGGRNQKSWRCFSFSFVPQCPNQCAPIVPHAKVRHLHAVLVRLSPSPQPPSLLIQLHSQFSFLAACRSGCACRRTRIAVGCDARACLMTRGLCWRCACTHRLMPREGADPIRSDPS